MLSHFLALSGTRNAKHLIAGNLNDIDQSMVRFKLSFRYSRTYLRQYLSLIFQSGYERLDRRKTSVSVKITKDEARKGGSCVLHMYDRKGRIESHNGTYIRYRGEILSTT